MVTISIIIPTLNEAANLGATLETLGREHEVIVADGGSHDKTREIAKEFNVTFCHSNKKNRASQMNQGAEIASGDLLLFLHADTLVPELSIENMTSAFRFDAQLAGGGFHRFFDSPSIFLKLTCRLANLRSKHCGLFLGDQGIFVRKEVFRALQGFNEDLSPGEDLDFSLRLKRAGKTIAIEPPVLSSARRFHQTGPIRQTLRDISLFFQIIRRIDNQS